MKIDWVTLEGKLIEMRNGERFLVNKCSSIPLSYTQSNQVFIKSICRYFLFYPDGRLHSSIDKEHDIIQVIGD